jgi:hypothetical protein
MVNYKYVRTHIRVKGRPVATQLPTHWNLISRSMTAPPPVLSPNSILLPPSSHFDFIPARKNMALVAKGYLNFLLLFKNFVMSEIG